MFSKYRPLTIMIIIILFFGSSLFYGYAVETKRTNVNISTTQVAHLPNSWKNVKIGYFSDTTIGANYSIETFTPSIKKLKETTPDIIFFAGNLLSKQNEQLILDEKIITELSELSAPLGKYAILGKDDTSEQQRERVTHILETSGFMILSNTNKFIYNRTLEPLNLIAINHTADEEKKKELLATSAETPSLLLTNLPALYDQTLAHKNLTLTLSSSTYGGLIGIPFINTLFVASEDKSYLGGYYQNGDHTLFVSSGLGTPDNFPIRLFNNPTVYNITLQKK